MVIAVLGAETIKDASIRDWEGGCFFGRKWSVACACMGCELTWVWGAMNAKWQDLISFAEALP